MFRPKAIVAALAVSCLTLAGLLVPAAAGASATTVPVAADSYTDESRPTTNLGNRTTMRLDASPATTSYLRFDVTGQDPAVPARLKLFVASNHHVGFEVRAVADDTWGELTLHHANAPAVGAVLDGSGPLQGGNWYLFDVSTEVQSAIQSDGQVSFALTTPSSTAISLSSREGSAPPELLLGTPPSPSPFVVSRDGDNYTATSSTGVTYSGTLKFAVESAVFHLNQHEGGTVSFGAGTFDFGSGFLKLYDVADITFEGQGMDVTIIRNYSDIDDDTEPFNMTGAFRVTVRDLTVHAGGPVRLTSDALDFDQGNDVRIERVKVTASRGRGIVFDGKNAGWTAERNVVEDCVVSGVPGDGIELLASSHNRIEGCTITDVGGHGIQVVKSTATADQPNKKSNDSVMTGNVIDNSGQDGINVLGGDRNEISGNTITDSSTLTSGRAGIRITSGDSVTSEDNVIRDNTATDTRAVKLQKYGLDITSLAVRTVVGVNDFTGNRVGPIHDVGSGTIYS